MIGWRPVICTVVAALLVAVAVLDVVASQRTATTDALCDKAHAVLDAGFPTAARSSYAAIVKQHPGARCATDGVLASADDECAHLQRIGQADPAQARKLLLALAGTAPRLPPEACVWGALADIAPAKPKAA
ncbi:MAG: hypothetical protein JWR63_4065 [Conexibacter sp.]|nr:hypothetical protein [Conexibacter sp.]